MLKIKVVNVTFGCVSTLDLMCKPCKGDILPITYINEVIESVLHVTQLLIDTHKDLNLISYDLLVFTK